MATLLIGAVVNIAVGLLINKLFPQKGASVEGPRLGDLTVSSSAYGGMIAIHEGTVRTAGNMIWGQPIEEVPNTQTQSTGKGGGQSVSQTTYSYFASFAMSFGEGEAADVLRIWADGKLIYDKTQAASNLGGLNIRFYPGNETQEPDPLIEAAEGVGNVPAHRGMCYVVFERLPLANFGNRIPNITAEITYNAMRFNATRFLTRTSVYGGGGLLTLDPRSDQFYRLSGTVVRGSAAGMNQQANSVSPYSGLSGVSNCYCMNGKFYKGEDSSNTTGFMEHDAVTMEFTGRRLGVTGIFGSWGDFGVFTNGAAIGALPTKGGDVFLVNGRSVGVFQNGGFVLYWVDSITGRRYQDSTYAFSAREGGTGNGGPIIQDFQNNRIFSVQDGSASFSVYEISGNLLPLGTLGPADGSLTACPGIAVRKVGTYSKPGDLVSVGNDDVLGLAGGDCYLPNEHALILSDGSSMCKIDLDSGAVLARNASLGFVGSHLWSTDGQLVFPAVLVSQSMNMTFTTISTESLQVIRTEVANASAFPGVDQGWFSGNNFGWGYDPRDGSVMIAYDGSASVEYVKMFLNRATGEGVDLSAVVGRMCERAQLTAEEYDVSELVGETVEGYSIGTQGPVRSAVEPLMRGYLFEGVESDWKIKFVRRGGASVVTIGEAEVGLLKDDDQIGPVKETRVQEIELPERFAIKFIDRDKDYSTGSQSDKRNALPTPTQNSRNDVSLELPLVAKSQPMKQLAQRWLYTSWAERASIESVLGWKYLRLDPTDVFSLSFRGELRRLRMSTSDFGADLAVSFVATQEDEASDTSGIPADGGAGYIPQEVPSLYPTQLFMLNAPLLRDVDDAGSSLMRGYWAAGGFTAGWPGCTLMQSLDSGTSYQALGSQSLESTWGGVSGTVPDPTTTTTWDYSAVITLKVQRGIDSLVSATELEVLNGANAIAVLRTDGSCEVIQFQTVTVVDAFTVQISKLLRGRRGTEDIAYGHTASETWVLLEPARMNRFTLPLSLRNVVAEYRAVTSGTLLEDSVLTPKAYTGEDLKPYSVCNVKAVVNASNIDVTWERRTRIGGELRDGTGVAPLSEDSEAYEMDVKTGPGGSVTQTLTSTTTSKSIPLGTIPAQLLVPFNTNANDTSVNLATGTLGSQAAIQTVEKKFGAGAVEFTPSGSVDPSQSFVQFNDIAAYNIAASDFTCEFWVRFKNLTATQQVFCGQYLNTGNQRGWALRRNGNNLQFDCSFTTASGGSNGVTTDLSVSGAFTWVINTWYHVAVVRQGGTLSLYVDGALVGSNNTLSTKAIFNSTAVFHIGKLRSAGFDDFPVNGFIDDFRLVNGQAVYTAPFTPPAAQLIDGTLPTSVTVQIYQMSAQVGRGRSREVTIPL